MRESASLGKISEGIAKEKREVRPFRGEKTSTLQAIIASDRGVLRIVQEDLETLALTGPIEGLFGLMEGKACGDKRARIDDALG